MWTEPKPVFDCTQAELHGRVAVQEGVPALHGLGQGIQHGLVARSVDQGRGVGQEGEQAICRTDVNCAVGVSLTHGMRCGGHPFAKSPHNQHPVDGPRRAGGGRVEESRGCGPFGGIAEADAVYYDTRRDVVAAGDGSGEIRLKVRGDRDAEIRLHGEE
ncbi:hypothetical protein [Streptomyces phaeoluteigriseus]